MLIKRCTSSPIESFVGSGLVWVLSGCGVRIFSLCPSNGWVGFEFCVYFFEFVGFFRDQDQKNWPMISLFGCDCWKRGKEENERNVHCWKFTSINAMYYILFRCSRSVMEAARS